MTNLDTAIDIMNIAESNAKELRKQCCTLWLDAIREKYNLMEGSTVKYKGKLYRVSTIEIPFGFSLGKPWIKGNPKNSDGTWSIGERNLFTYWEVVQG